MPWDPGYDAGGEYDRVEFLGGTVILLLIALAFWLLT